MSKFEQSIDRWLTGGNNWRLLSIIGIIGLFGVLMVFGENIKRNTPFLVSQDAELQKQMQLEKVAESYYGNLEKEIKTQPQEDNKIVAIIKSRKLETRHLKKKWDDWCRELKGGVNKTKRCKSDKTDEYGPLYWYFLKT